LERDREEFEMERDKNSRGIRGIGRKWRGIRAGDELEMKSEEFRGNGQALEKERERERLKRQWRATERNWRGTGAGEALERHWSREELQRNCIGIERKREREREKLKRQWRAIERNWRGIGAGEALERHWSREKLERNCRGIERHTRWTASGIGGISVESASSWFKLPLV
jgi:hypothetical protein